MKLHYRKNTGNNTVDGFEIGFHNIVNMTDAIDAIEIIFAELRGNSSTSYTDTDLDTYLLSIKECDLLDEVNDLIDELTQIDIFMYCLKNKGYFVPDNNYIEVYKSYNHYREGRCSFIMAESHNNMYMRITDEIAPYVFYCEISDVYFTRYATGFANDRYETPDGYIVHQMCTENDSLHYYHNSGEWYLHEDNVPYEDDEDDDSYDEDTVYVDSYHSGGSEYLEINNDSNQKFMIGIEVEKEDEDVRNGISLYNFKDSVHKGWRKESDSSLDHESGFELISPYMKLLPEDIINMLNSNPVLQRHINADYSRSCGGHIHLSLENTSGCELYDMLCGYFPVLLSMYRGRIRNSYSSAGSKEDMKSGNRMAINTKRDRIEIRVFSAVRNTTQLEFRLKLLEFITANPTDDYKTAVDKLKKNFKKLFGSIYSREQFNNMLNRANVYSVDFAFASSEEEILN